jgi:hypothetical protein
MKYDHKYLDAFPTKFNQEDFDLRLYLVIHTLPIHGELL